MDWQKLKDELEGIEFESNNGVVYTLTGNATLGAKGDHGHVGAQLTDLIDGSFKVIET